MLHRSSYKMIGVYPKGANKKLVKNIVAVLKAKGWQGRRYAYGKSMGGALSQDIGTDSTMGFSGIAPQVANLRTSWRASTCTGPLAVLSLGGTNDRTVPYYGGKNFKSAEETNRLWAQVNGCDERFETVKVKTIVKGADAVAEKMIWKCPVITPQIHYKVIGMGHGGLDGRWTSEVVLDFFTKIDKQLDAAGKPAVPTLPDSCRQR